MKKIILLLALFIVLILFPLATGFTIEEGVRIEPSDSNTSYIFGTDFSFDEIIVENNSVYFNDNIFQIEADSGSVNVTINSLNSMSFTVEAMDTVTFVLGGFDAGTKYTVEVDGNSWSTVTADSGGILRFEYSSWSSHTFTISTWLSAEILPSFIDSVGMISNLLIAIIIIVLLVFVIGIIFGKGVSVDSFGIFIIDVIIVMVLLFVLILIVMSIASVA